MNLDTLLSSVIASSSILIAIGFPFIIFVFSNYKRRREILLSQMKDLYPKFNNFRELIYYITQIDFWENRSVIKDYKKAIQNGNNSEKESLLENNEFLYLYACYSFISHQYSNDIINKTKKVYTFQEISNYQIKTNYMWLAIYHRTDFKKHIDNNCFNNIDNYNLNRINRVITKLGIEDASEALSIEKIANIAGEIEVSVLDSLSDLTLKYESPLDPIIKRLFGILSIALIFGVIIPLLLLIITSTFTIYIAIVTVIIIIICFIAIMVLTGMHIGIL